MIFHVRLQHQALMHALSSPKHMKYRDIKQGLLVQPGNFIISKRINKSDISPDL